MFSEADTFQLVNASESVKSSASQVKDLGQVQAFDTAEQGAQWLDAANGLAAGWLDTTTPKDQP